MFKANMTVVGENGSLIECRVIAKWVDNGKDYIAYTDGTIKDGKEEVSVSALTLENGKTRLKEITNDEEWNRVENYLKENLENGDDFNE